MNPLRTFSRAAPVALLLVATACFQPASPGVGLKPITADLIFGIPPLEEPVAAPDLSASAAPVRSTGPTLPGPPTIPPPPVTSTACPQATLNVVDKAATPSVEGRPAEGMYKWVQRETVFVEDQFVGRFDVTTSRLVRRGLFDVGESPIGEFRYKTFWPVAGGGDDVLYYVFTWDVITEAPTTGGPVNVTQEQGTVNGLYMSEWRRITIEEGRVTDDSTFVANPPVLFLPFPVRPGFQRTTNSVDPSTLETLQVSITVRNTSRWDACGEVVEGWVVEANVNNQFRATSTTYKYNFGVASQYGAMLVYEHYEIPCPARDATGSCVPPPDEILDTNIGQVDPSNFAPGDIPKVVRGG